MHVGSRNMEWAGLSNKASEEQRLEELERYRILDTGKDARFETIAALASRTLKLPVALIKLVDAERQWTKASTRTEGGSLGVSQQLSAAAKVTRTGEMIVCNNAKTDAFLCNHPGVRAGKLVSLIAAPLRNHRGFVLGALVAWSGEQRRFTNDDVQIIKDLAAITMDELELHRAALENTLATKHLSQTERLYQATFENASVGMAHVSLDGRYLKVNQRLCDILGYEKTELVGMNFRSTTLREDLKKHDLNRRVLHNGEKHSFLMDKRYVRKDGRIVWACLSVTLQTTPEGEPLHQIAIIRDITPRKTAEAELRASQELYKSTFDNAAVGIATVRKDGKIIDANDKFQKIIGHTREALNQLRYFDLVHPDDVELHKENRNKIFAGEAESFTLEHRMLKSNGRSIWVRVTAAAFWPEDSEPPHAVKVVEHIDAQKKAEEARNFLIRELNHHVKNTLATVRGMVNKIAQNKSSVQEIIPAIDNRLQSMSQAHRLLTDNNWSEVSIGYLIKEQIIAPFDEELNTKNLRISGPDIYLNPHISVTLGMVLYELMTNALKYGALSVSSGQLELTWQENEDGEAKELKLNWSETGGPEVKTPIQKGFGYFMVERGVQLGLGGSSQISYRPDGLQCCILIPLFHQSKSLS